jgi:hypothetical protein
LSSGGRLSGFRGGASCHDVSLYLPRITQGVADIPAATANPIRGTLHLFEIIRHTNPRKTLYKSCTNDKSESLFAADLLSN